VIWAFMMMDRFGTKREVFLLICVSDDQQRADLFDQKQKHVSSSHQR
jgi:hypothetical protein